MGDIPDETERATPSVPRVELSGTPFEIGIQHGTLLRTQIHSQLSVYHNIFKSLSNLSWSQVLSFAERFQPTIQRLAPELYREMEGIAEGAGVEIMEIVALNARSEIALGVSSDMGEGDQDADGCTSLAWTVGEGGETRKHFLAQNWDWTEDVGKNLALASIKQIGKPKIWMVIEPGIVGKIGFNSSSVGVCLNAIRAKAISTSLLPIHLLLRIALQSTSVDQAISEIERLGGSASSQHILIADVTNGGRALEVSPFGNAYLGPDGNGVVVHANHFIANRYVEEIPWNIGSHPRLVRIRELVDQIRQGNANTNLKRSVTPSLLRERIFADTQGAPQGICCYRPGNETDGRTVGTLFNIVMVFEDGKEPYAEVVFGRPTKEGYGWGPERATRMPW